MSKTPNRTELLNMVAQIEEHNKKAAKHLAQAAAIADKLKFRLISFAPQPALIDVVAGGAGALKNSIFALFEATGNEELHMPLSALRKLCPIPKQTAQILQDWGFRTQPSGRIAYPEMVEGQQAPVWQPYHGAYYELPVLFFINLK